MPGMYPKHDTLRAPPSEPFSGPQFSLWQDENPDPLLVPLEIMKEGGTSPGLLLPSGRVGETRVVCIFLLNQHLGKDSQGFADILILTLDLSR